MLGKVVLIEGTDFFTQDDLLTLIPEVPRGTKGRSKPLPSHTTEPPCAAPTSAL